MTEALFTFDDDDDFTDETEVTIEPNAKKRRAKKATTHREAEAEATEAKRERDAKMSPIARRNRELKALATGIELYAPDHIIERASMLMGGIDVDPCTTQLGKFGRDSWYGYQWEPQDRVDLITGFQGDNLDGMFVDDAGNAWVGDTSPHWVDRKAGPDDPVRYALNTDDGLRHTWYGKVWLFPPKGPIAEFRPEMAGQFNTIQEVWWQALMSHVELGNVSHACYLCEDISDLTHDMLRFPLVFFEHELDYRQPQDTCCGKALPLTELEAAPKRGRRSVLVVIGDVSQGDIMKHFGDIGRVMVPA